MGMETESYFSFEQHFMNMCNIEGESLLGNDDGRKGCLLRAFALVVFSVPHFLRFFVASFESSNFVFRPIFDKGNKGTSHYGNFDDLAHGPTAPGPYGPGLEH